MAKAAKPKAATKSKAKAAAKSKMAVKSDVRVFSVDTRFQKMARREGGIPRDKASLCGRTPCSGHTAVACRSIPWHPTGSPAPRNPSASRTQVGHGATSALQQRLTDGGCYQGVIDGQARPSLQVAIDACPSQEPVLRIETGMHVAQISRIGVDRACRIAATGSEDIWPRVQIRGVEADYVSARKHRSAGFRCEPKAPPAEWASAAERSPRYKPRPTMLVQRSSHQEIWFRSI
jgi:hypothetical protein